MSVNKLKLDIFGKFFGEQTLILLLKQILSICRFGLKRVKSYILSLPCKFSGYICILLFFVLLLEDIFVLQQAT